LQLRFGKDFGLSHGLKCWAKGVLIKFNVSA
jgi:hypothetical protein